MIEEKMKLYDSLKSIFLHIDNHEKAFFAEYGLNVPRFYTLFHISNHPGISYIELSDLLLCTKSNTTRIVQGMQKDGLVSRQSRPGDGRSFSLTLTPQGEALFKQVYPNYLQLVDRLMSRFNADEIKLYTHYSQHVESVLGPNEAGQFVEVRLSESCPAESGG